MPNINDPNTLANPNADWFTGEVPGGDTPLDELFPADSSVTTQQTTAPSGTAPNASAPSQTGQPNFEFKTSTGTVYKSMEDAIKGTEEKDRLLETLRQRYIMERGIDPLQHDRPVSINQNPQAPVNYMQDNKRYMQDLKTAVDKGDESAYFNAQAKLVFDLLQPLAGTINNAAKEQAVQSVSSEVKDFQNFRNSPEFASVLSDNPSLKNAIETSENDFRGHAQLPELYRLAYYAAQGRKVPDLIKQATQAAAQAAPPTPVRPTLGQSTVAPQNPNQFRQSPDMSTSAGRQEIIKQWEQGGGTNLKF